MDSREDTLRPHEQKRGKMRESFLKLNDRTVVLAGPLNQITSTIVTVMSERGCDVGIVTNERTNEVQRFCDNINDAREVHHNYGRSACIAADLDSEKSCTEAIGRVAETFGSIDIVVDTHLLELTENGEDLEARFEKTKTMCEAAMPFVQGRNKGRIVFLTNDLLLKSFSKIEELMSMKKEFSQKVLLSNITMNCISTGITEELLLKMYGATKSIKDAFKDYEEKNGKCRIIEPTEVASLVSFVASPISSALNGQTSHMNAGAEN
jgi:NAD(P)-dependent dehydrogenase (short-subunit alcohol dehydrogenase family)